MKEKRLIDANKIKYEPMLESRGNGNYEEVMVALKDQIDDIPSAQSDGDLTSRENVKEWLTRWKGYLDEDMILRMQYRVCDIPSAQPETCEGCKHLGKWENEVEYGYPSPCTCCERGTEDHYERRTNE